MKTDTRVIYIDGDILAYQCAYAGEINQYDLINNGTSIYQCQYRKDIDSFMLMLDDTEGLTIEKSTRILSKSVVERNVERTLNTIMESSGCDVKVVYLSGSSKDNFRNDVATTLPYKGNRVDKVKPHYYPLVRKILTNKHYARHSEYCEADDMLAIAITEDKNGICGTIDKDLRTVQGWHYHLRTKTVDYVTKQQADYNFAIQMLIGDTADNIPGLSYFFKENDMRTKVGPATATKILGDSVTRIELMKAVLPMYVQALGTKELALTTIQETCSLLWMQRKTGQVFDIKDWTYDRM